MDAKGNCIQGSCWEMKLEHLDADKKMVETIAAEGG